MSTKYFDLVNRDYVPTMFDFKCKDSFFSDYLKTTAFYDKKNQFGITHLFLEEDDKYKRKVIGFFTLKNTSLVIREEDDGTREGFPAIEISQLATHKELERQGIGRIMIDTIIAKTYELTNVSAIKYIVLCATGDSIGFYRKMEFEFLEDEKMFIPREKLNKGCRVMFKNISLQEDQ